MFSYTGRVKSPEWRWRRRRADLRHFEIFRHGFIIIYTRLPAGGTYYPICTFPASSECLTSISDAFFFFWPFVYGYPLSSPRAHCTPNKSVPTLRYTRRLGPIYLYRSMPEGSYWVPSPGLPKIVCSTSWTTRTYTLLDIRPLSLNLHTLMLGYSKPKITWNNAFSVSNQNVKTLKLNKNHKFDTSPTLR